MTDEYLDQKWKDIEARMQKFEDTACPQDKLFLDCMIRDWEAKMRLKIKHDESN